MNCPSRPRLHFLLILTNLTRLKVALTNSNSVSFSDRLQIDSMMYYKEYKSGKNSVIHALIHAYMTSLVPIITSTGWKPQCTANITTSVDVRHVRIARTGIGSLEISMAGKLTRGSIL